MSEIRILICDDDPSCLKNTLKAVMRWSDEYGVSVKTELTSDGDSLLESCKKEKADIILLDIMMPLINGMDAARELRRYDCNAKIIFLTSSPEFAIESYDVKASGYILKPALYEKVAEILCDCARDISKKPDTITIRTSLGYQSIYKSSIECAEAQNKKVIFTLSGGECKSALETLSYYESMLTLEDGFFKCHRSYIVSFPAVDHFTGAELYTKSGIRVPIARGIGKQFQEAYFAYMFKGVGSVD